MIYGCGGHARSIINTLVKSGCNKEIILVDENANDGEEILGCKVFKSYELKENDSYIVGIGDNQRRKKVFQKLSKMKTGLTVISSSADIGVGVSVDAGVFVAANVYIGPCCKVGTNTIINTGSIIEHETIIGDNTHIAVGATVCGRCRIGNNVFCGAGSTVIDNISICDNVIIGAGGVVITDITEPGKYVGVPVKKIGDYRNN